MKLKIIGKWLPLLIVALMAAPASAAETQALKTHKEKVSYSVGAGVARNIQAQQVEVDVDLVVKGLKDVLAGGQLLMTEDEIQLTTSRMQAEIKQKRDYSKRVATLENRKAGDAFLAANGKKEGVVTLPSGLQYKILKAGDGKKPAVTDRVECRYRGTLLNGKEFDNSERSGQPTVTVPVKGLIPGVREAIQLMPAGSKWQLFIPSKLGYGERVSGLDIGPNATLIFEMELIGIK